MRITEILAKAEDKPLAYAVSYLYGAMKVPGSRGSTKLIRSLYEQKRELLLEEQKHTT